MKKIIVLGGGADQKDLIEKLKARGFYTILIDYYDNPIAKSVADLHIKASTLDKEIVLDLVKKHQVENIITACTDQALTTVAYVAQHMNFPTQFSYEEILNMTNKVYMKKIMFENEIPTSPFVNRNEICKDDFLDLNYPLIVKPADCNGSFGVKKVTNAYELKQYFYEAKRISRTQMVIVEEFKYGKEIGIDCFIKNGKAEILLIGELCKRKMDDHTSIIYQSYFPPEISQHVKDKLQIIANKIAQVFHLDNTPLLIQTIVQGDDVNVIEFAPRIGGGAKHRTIHKITGFDILNANIDVCLGLSPCLEYANNPDIYSRVHLYVYPSVFGRVDEDIIKELKDTGLIEEFVLNKTCGMEIQSIQASKDRIGSFFVKAPNRNVLNNKIKEILDCIKIYDIDGNEILNRDIYDSEYTK